MNRVERSSTNRVKGSLNGGSCELRSQCAPVYPGFAVSNTLVGFTFTRSVKHAPQSGCSSR